MNYFHQPLIYYDTIYQKQSYLALRQFEVAGSMAYFKWFKRAFDQTTCQHFQPAGWLQFLKFPPDCDGCSDNVVMMGVNSHNSPLSIVSSQASRCYDGSAFVPVCPPPSYHTVKGHSQPQAANLILPPAVQVFVHRFRSRIILVTNLNMFLASYKSVSYDPTLTLSSPQRALFAWRNLPFELAFPNAVICVRLTSGSLRGSTVDSRVEAVA